MNEDHRFEEFIRNEVAGGRAIALKVLHVDMAGDLVAGLILNQIVYRLTADAVDHEPGGERCLVRARADWWEECRVTPKQVDRALRILREKGLIRTEKRKVKGVPTTHIWLQEARYMALRQAVIDDTPAREDARDGATYHER